MLSLPSSVRIFLCLEHTDMRRGFDALARMAREVIAQDPLSGHLFVFRSRRGDRLKISLLGLGRPGRLVQAPGEGVFAFPGRGAQPGRRRGGPGADSGGDRPGADQEKKKIRKTRG